MSERNTYCECRWALYDGETCMNPHCKHYGKVPTQTVSETKDEQWDWIGKACAEHTDLTQQLAAKEAELAELREKLQDPNTVHVNILHGQIKLTKAQAIHIAGLPADVEEQLAELRRDRERLRFILEAEWVHNMGLEGMPLITTEGEIDWQMRVARDAAIRHSQTDGEGEG